VQLPYCLRFAAIRQTHASAAIKTRMNSGFSPAQTSREQSIPQPFMHA
jgi:hypothetical protein